MGEPELADPVVKSLRQSSLRGPGSFKNSAMSGRSTPRGSPSYRRAYSARTPRRENAHSVAGKFSWIRGNRVVFWLILITLWTYIGFAVQSKWAHDANGREFVDRSLPKALSDDDDISSIPGGELLRKVGVRGSKKVDASPSLSKKTSSHRKLKNKSTFEEIDRIPKKNTSYGMLVGPFGATEESILEWSAGKRRGTCDRKSRFANLVWSRSFLLIFHELSMTGAPLTMMELATELLSCGATVSVIALNRQGGLLPELNKRGIRVNDKGEASFKMAMKRDLIIAGSAVCSSWIGM